MTQSTIRQPDKELIIAEYGEAANAYFEGVTLGYSVFKGYITANGLFVAAIGAIGESRLNFAGSPSVMNVIPFFALLISFTLLLSLGHYFRHLENCRLRCEQLEALWGGALFTQLGVIANKSSGVNAAIGMFLTIFVIVIFWLAMAFPEYLALVTNTLGRFFGQSGLPSS